VQGHVWKHRRAVGNVQVIYPRMADQEDRSAVILDHGIPGMSDLDLAASLRRRQPRLPILMVSTSFQTLGRYVSLC
jgi:DNA-binding response OmpR family regulator